MAIVSKCPKCQQQVTSPDGVAAEAEVRCPLCAVVYRLSEAMAEAPPALIPVDVGAAPQIDTGRTPVDAGALAAFGAEEAKGQYEPIDGRRSKHRRTKRRNEKSAARFLIEVFLGGIFGLTIGYYVACWAGLDMPRFPLPLLPHTMHWFTHAEKPGDDAPPPASEKPDVPNRHPQPRSEEPRPSEQTTVRPGTPPVPPPTTAPETAAEAETETAGESGPKP